MGDKCAAHKTGEHNWKAKHGQTIEEMFDFDTRVCSCGLNYGEWRAGERFVGQEEKSDL